MSPLSAPKTQTPADQGWLSRLKIGLARTRAVLTTDVGDLVRRAPRVDDALFEALETTLIQADVGARAAARLIDDLRARQRAERIADGDALMIAFRRVLTDSLVPVEQAFSIPHLRPFVIMVAGVNGAGKTTTIGKLAKYFQSHGKSVLLAAGDTFRAAAREQLAAWGARNGVTVIAQQGGDPAAVIYDAIHAARARGVDIVLADTAGRLPTQLHLMEEIKKVKRVIAKADPAAPHETWLVLDANTGQNAVSQVRAFDDALGLTGLIVTKLDGTAKGGMIAALALERSERPIPVRFIGVGEGLDDLRPFAVRDYVEALLD